MGVRFRGIVKTTFTNTTYTVELWDSTYSGAVTDLTLFGEGFEIIYEGQGDEIYSPIKGSSCKVICGITRDAKGTALESWINNSVLATKEDLYHVAIYEGSNFHWFGVILPSLGDTPDDSKPYDFVIQATDGLARLKDTEFELAKNSAINLPSQNYSFTELIFELLKFTPLYTATTQSILFSTCVGYYENSMPAKAGNIDPLNYSEINAATFTTLEDNKDVIGDSIYDALTKICESWGMRLMLSGGLFRFYQVQSYEDDGVIRYERFYSRFTGAYVLNNTFSGYNEDLRPNTTTRIPRPKNGNQWSFYDPLKFVFLKVPFDAKGNMLLENALMVNSNFPTISDPTLYNYQQDLRDNILGGIGRRLNFQTVINLSILLGLNTFFDVTIRIKIKIGIYYLKKDILSSIVTWTTNSSDFYEFIIPNVQSRGTNLNIALTTPDLPIGTHSNNQFYIVINEVIYPVTGSIVAVINYRAKLVVGSTSLKYNSSSDNVEETYFEYIVGNSSSPINSYDIELPDTNICEAFDISNPGNLFINNGTSLVPSAGLWRVEDTGSTYDFPMIRVRDVLTSQIIATKKYQGAIIGQMIYGHSSFDYSGTRYIMNGATYKAASETWDGEWIQVSYSRASFEEIQGAVNQAGNGGEGQLRRELGELTNRDNIGNNLVNSLVVQQQINNTTLDASGTITSLSVGSFSDTVREGDYLRVLSQEGGGNIVLRASADSSGTTVNIDSYTLPNTLPINSSVLFDLADIIERVRLGNIKVNRFATNRTLSPYSQIAIGVVNNVEITLPSLADSYNNNRSIEITIKNNCSHGSDKVILKGGGADIEISGNTTININQGHALTLFTDGVIWLIKCSFKHE